MSQSKIIFHNIAKSSSFAFSQVLFCCLFLKEDVQNWKHNYLESGPCPRSVLVPKTQESRYTNWSGSRDPHQGHITFSAQLHSAHAMGCIFHFGDTNTRIQTHTHTKKIIQNVKCNLHIFLLHKKIFISLNIDLKKVTFKKKKLQYIHLFPPCLLRWICSSGSLEFHFPIGNWARTKPATWQRLGRWWDQNWDPQFSGTVLVLRKCPVALTGNPRKARKGSLEGEPVRARHPEWRHRCLGRWARGPASWAGQPEKLGLIQKPRDSGSKGLVSKCIL